MASSEPRSDARIAVLVDCDNTSPEILEYSLRVVAQFGRIVLRRGYGNHNTLANKWQEALVRLAFSRVCSTNTQREKTRRTLPWLWTRWVSGL